MAVLTPPTTAPIISPSTPTGATGATAPHPIMPPTPAPGMPPVAPAVAPVAPAVAPVAPNPTVAPVIAPEPEVLPAEPPVNPTAPIANNAVKINGIMLWYAVSAFAYAFAFQKAVQDIQSNSTGNGLFPLNTSIGIPQALSPDVIKKQVIGGTEALNNNKKTTKEILAELPEDQAATVRADLKLDADLDSEI